MLEDVPKRIDDYAPVAVVLNLLLMGKSAFADFYNMHLKHVQ